MAKSRSDDLFDRLHAQGLRKRTAKLLSQATDGRRKPARAVQRSLNDVKQAVAHVEDRLTGGPERSLQQMSPPRIEQATADAVASRHRDWRYPRLQALRRNLPLLLNRPAPPPLAARNYLDPLIASAHTISRMSAALYVAATSAGGIARGHPSDGGEVRAC